MKRIEVTDELAQRFSQEHIAWLTTVRHDGMPQPTPVWFLWQEGEFLIFSQPDAQKIRNIRSNPNVALNFNSDESGEVWTVVMGEARIDELSPRSIEIPQYIEKYREHIALINFTPESLSAMFSTLIRVRPTKVRSQ